MQVAEASGADGGVQGAERHGAQHMEAMPAGGNKKAARVPGGFSFYAVGRT